jgi:hypothetical protein
MRFLIAAAMLLVVCAPAWGITVTTEETGEIAFLEGNQSFTSAMCGAFGPGWAWTSQADAYDRVDSVLLPERPSRLNRFAGKSH